MHASHTFQDPAIFHPAPATPFNPVSGQDGSGRRCEDSVGGRPEAQERAEVEKLLPSGTARNRGVALALMLAAISAIVLFVMYSA